MYSLFVLFGVTYDFRSCTADSQMTWKQVVDLNLDLDFTAVLSNKVVGLRMMLVAIGLLEQS